MDNLLFLLGVGGAMLVLGGIVGYAAGFSEGASSLAARVKSLTATIDAMAGHIIKLQQRPINLDGDAEAYRQIRERA